MYDALFVRGKNLEPERPAPCVCQRCTGGVVSEWTPDGVLTIFENRSGAGVDFSKEGPEPESVLMRLVCLLLIIIIADRF